LNIVLYIVLEKLFILEHNLRLKIVKFFTYARLNPNFHMLIKCIRDRP